MKASFQIRDVTGRDFRYLSYNFFIAWRALSKTTRDTIMQQVTERFAQVASDDNIEIDGGKDEDEMEEEDDDDDNFLGETDANEEDEEDKEDDIDDNSSFSSTDPIHNKIPMHSSTASHLRTRKFILLMTRAREVWRGCDHDIKNSWREYANRLN